jgi:glycosyltransferase involved in cell wall biosynthesis
LLTVFIDILNKNQDFKNKAHLLLIGDGELKPKVLKIIKDYNANISNLGFIDQKHIPFYYKISDIFIIPSKEENWGLTVNEAMCCGLPIIASDKVGSGYDLLDSNNSFKFRHDNQYELSQILLKSLNSDLKKMSRFSIKKISLFNNLLNMKVIEEIIT